MRECPKSPDGKHQYTWRDECIWCGVKPEAEIVPEERLRRRYSSSNQSRTAIVTFPVDEKVKDADSFHEWLKVSYKSALAIGYEAIPEYDLLSITENLKTIWERR